MADSYSFYMTQADAARKSGDAAKLENVRESFFRAEGVWRALADKAQRVADARQMREGAAADARAALQQANEERASQIDEDASDADFESSDFEDSDFEEDSVPAE